MSDDRDGPHVGGGQYHNTAWEAHVATIESGSKLTQTDKAGATALAGPIIILLIAPLIISFLFGLVFGLLFRAKIVGRIIQSVLMGIIIGFTLLMTVGGLIEPMLNNAFLRILVVAVFFGLPTLWYYCSHYFSLNAVSLNGLYEVELDDKGNIIDRYQGIIKHTVMLFAFTVAFAFYGSLVFVILNTFDIISIPSIAYLIPVGAGAAYYTIKVLKAQKFAGMLRRQTKNQIIGLPIAIALALFLPMGAFTGGEMTVEGKPTVIISNNVRMRASPDLESETIKTLNYGDEVTVIGKSIKATDKKTDIMLVEYEGATGYVREYYLSQHDPFKDALTHNVSAVVTQNYTRDGAFIAATPSFSARKVKWIKKKTILTVTGEAVQHDSNIREFWVPVEHDGARGFIPESYIRRQNNRTTNNSAGANTVSTPAASAASNDTQTQQATVQTAVEAVSFDTDDTDYSTEELNATPAEGEDW